MPFIGLQVPFGSGKWKNYAKIGMVVEIPHPKNPKVYWWATVFGFAGYHALVEYVRNDKTSSEKLEKAWIPFCSKIPKPFGYCMKNNIPLLPIGGKKEMLNLLIFNPFK